MPIDLQAELTDLRRTLLAMGALVEQRLGQALDALQRDDITAAERVRHNDGDIDDMDRDIEAECLRVLALSQPVAGDLRFVLSAMRINADLERIGDNAKSIAKRVLSLQNEADLEPPPALREMSTETLSMLSDALRALADQDSELAKRVRRNDQRVDDLQKEMFAWVQREIPRNVDATTAAIDLLSIARKLERVADLATNIAEDTIFLVEGSIVRHQKI